MILACADRRCASCSVSLAECDKCYPGYSMLLDAFNITLECVRVCPTGYKTEIINKTKLCIPKKDAGNFYFILQVTLFCYYVVAENREINPKRKIANDKTLHQ